MKKIPPLTSGLAFVASLFCITTLIFGTQKVHLEKTIRSLQESLKNSSSSDMVQKMQDEKKTLESAIEKLQSEKELLENKMKKSGEDAKSALEEKTYLEDILIHKTKEIEQLKAQPSAPGAPLTDDREITKQLKEKIEELKKMEDHNKILSQKLERLYKTTSAKIAEINVAKITLEDTIAKARQEIDNEWNTVDLGSITVDKNGGVKDNKPAERKEAKKEGKVLAVNEDHGFVVVDLGKIDGIKSDTTISLVKNGQPVGTLSVLEVRDAMTACNIKEITQGQKIQINDAVSIQKP